MGDVEAVWSTVKEEIAARGFLVFPNPPLSEEGLASPIALWPEERSLSEFLDLATALGVRLVYAWADRISEDDLADLKDTQADGDDEVKAALRRFESYVGQVRSASVQFAFGGVIHGWEERAPWEPELRSLFESSGEFGRRGDYVRPDTALANLEQKYEDRMPEWIDLISRDGRFRSAPKGGGKTSAVLRIVSELGRLSQEDQTGAVSWFASHLAGEASHRYRTVIVPEEERELARRGREMIDEEGLSRTDAAGRLGMGKDKLGRLLAMYQRDGDG